MRGCYIASLPLYLCGRLNHRDEAAAAGNTQLSDAVWREYTPGRGYIPQQQNDYDCGAFIII